MLDNSQRYVISFNGEIYNFKEIRKRLISKICFQTKSDTEVILESYVLWKEKAKFLKECLFAIWDRQTETLFIARDRMGEKIIFLVPYEGENFNKGLIFF